MIEKRVLFARIPVALEVPGQMNGATAAVLDGEYESGYFGEKLSILDIGANVGSFAIWANMRWPDSMIHAYEPHPETFKALVANVGSLPNVLCHNQAVYPTENAHELFYSRYAGDGESGLVTCMTRTFEGLPQERTFSVPVIHPRALPKCDLLKIDVEGAEASILEHMDLIDVSMILLEYQDMGNRRRIEERLRADFTREFEDGMSWDDVLKGSEYRKDLAGNRFGHMFFATKHGNKLRKTVSDELTAGIGRRRETVPDNLSLKRLLAALPGVTKRALKRRLRRLSSASIGKTRT